VAPWCALATECTVQKKEGAYPSEATGGRSSEATSTRSSPMPAAAVSSGQDASAAPCACVSAGLSALAASCACAKGIPLEISSCSSCASSPQSSAMEATPACETACSVAFAGWRQSFSALSSCPFWPDSPAWLVLVPELVPSLRWIDGSEATGTTGLPDAPSFRPCGSVPLHSPTSTWQASVLPSLQSTHKSRNATAKARRPHPASTRSLATSLE